MEKKELFKKFRILLGMEKTNKIKLAKIASVDKYWMDVDNTEFKVGDKVTYIDYEGREQFLSDGQYELENGDTLQIDVNGIVVLYTPKVALSKEVNLVKILADGVEYEVNEDTLEVGMQPTITVDGEQMIMKAGEYKTDEGKIIVINEEGFITEIKDEETPDEEETEEETKLTVEEDVVMLKTELEALKLEVENLKAVLEGMVTEMSKEDEKLEKELKEKDEQIARLSRQPAVVAADEKIENKQIAVNAQHEYLMSKLNKK